AELGNDYAALRATQARVAIAHHTVDVETSLLELTRSQKGSGLASELDVARAQGQLDTTMAQLPLLEAQRLQAVHAIAILLGRLPETTDDELTADAPQLPLPPAVPMELPSAVLQNRPDIQQAERELAAATAQIGVAEAERFPSLSLTGSTGLASSQLDQLLRHSNWTWNAGASLSAPIFEGGRLQAQQRAAEAAAQQSDLQYRKTVLQALRETEDALQGYAAQIQHYDSLADAVAAGQVSLARATDLYRAGLGNYLDVLDADRSLAQLQDQLAQGGQDRVQQLIALYKALGGGWQAGERDPDRVDQVSVAPAPVANNDAGVSAPAVPNPPPQPR
ncbi:MAG: efflux transporter outer membrane subunit, partial [Nevskiales bacterium]